MKHSLSSLALSCLLFALPAQAGSSWLAELLASPGGRFLFVELGLGESAARIGTHRLFGLKQDPIDLLVTSTTERYLATRPEDSWIFSSAERAGVASSLQHLSRSQRTALRQAFRDASSEFIWLRDVPVNSYSANRAAFADGTSSPQRGWIDRANFIPGSDRAALEKVLDGARAARRAGTPGTVVIHLESTALDSQAAMAAALWSERGWLAQASSYEFPIARKALRGLHYSRLSSDPAQLFRSAGLDAAGEDFEEFRAFVTRLLADNGFIAKYGVARPGFVEYVLKLKKLGTEVVLFSSRPALTSGKGTLEAVKRMGLAGHPDVRVVLTPSHVEALEFRTQEILNLAREEATNVIAVFDNEASSLLNLQPVLENTNLIFVNTEMASTPTRAGRGLHLLESWLTSAPAGVPAF